MAVNKQEWIPTGDTKLTEWCLSKGGNKGEGKDIRALIPLIMWKLWKRRNSIVFDGATPSVGGVLRRIEEEGRAWKTAGIIKADVESFFAALAVGNEARS